MFVNLCDWTCWSRDILMNKTRTVALSSCLSIFSILRSAILFFFAMKTGKLERFCSSPFQAIPTFRDTQRYPPRRLP